MDLWLENILEDDKRRKLERKRQIMLHQVALAKKCGYIRNRYCIFYKKGTRNIHCKDKVKVRVLFFER